MNHGSPRLGTLIARPELIALLRSLMAPYPLPAPCAEAAMTALTEQALHLSRERIALTLSERERLRVGLTRLPGVVEVFASDANFLLVDFDEPEDVLAAARAARLLIRDMRGASPGSLRISVGTPEQNDRFLRSVR